MSKKLHGRQNAYSCCVEINQNGKYCVRIRAHFGRKDWDLPVYFLASSFDRAIRRLEEVFQLLQREEERLWFWGVDRSDDPNVAADMLRQSGLNLDRRGEFPDVARRYPWRRTSRCPRFRSPPYGEDWPTRSLPGVRPSRLPPALTKRVCCSSGCRDWFGRGP